MIPVNKSGRRDVVSDFANAAGTYDGIPIGTAATVYQNPKDGAETLLMFHEAIYMGDLVEGSLLIPNQM
jgi:hypothetical protein